MIHRGALVFFLFLIVACSASSGGSANTAPDAGIRDTAPYNELKVQPDSESLDEADNGFQKHEETMDSDSIAAEGDAEIVVTPPSPLVEVVTISGDITWHVDFSPEGL